MANIIKSKTPDNEKNRWSTTWECFEDAKKAYFSVMEKEFAVDVCAEPETAKVDRFYVSDEWLLENPDFESETQQILGVDALLQQWPRHWWCNPPFNLKDQFLEHANLMDEMGRPGLMLIPYVPSSKWWLKYVEGKAAIIFEPDGRYSFYKPDGVTKAGTPQFESCFVLFSKEHRLSQRRRITRSTKTRSS